MMHYAKGTAHAALGHVPAAQAEQALFADAVKRVPKSRYLHNVPCLQLLAVAEEMLAGEIAYRGGENDAAFARLRAAIALEDDLPYDEPWGWMQPVRHALGALLLEQDHTAEAEAVSRPRRGIAPRPNPPGQPVGPARAAGMPPAARRNRGGRANLPASGLRRRPRRYACVGVLLVRSRQGRLSDAWPRQ